MSDRELLELAAKAAGHGDVWSLDEHPDVTYIGPRYDGGTVRYRVWNPLTDDGDALRLAVKLRLVVDIGGVAPTHERIYVGGLEGYLAHEPTGADIDAATRRAITRAAAEIGKGM
jgi:hypothetical protein